MDETYRYALIIYLINVLLYCTSILLYVIRILMYWCDIRVQFLLVIAQVELPLLYRWCLLVWKTIWLSFKKETQSYNSQYQCPSPDSYAASNWTRWRKIHKISTSTENKIRCWNHASLFGWGSEALGWFRMYCS